MGKYLSYLLVSWLLLPTFAGAQQGKRYSFTHYSNGSGLASNEVIDVLQDEEGYMWIAGTNGLQRFDGVRFTTFRHRKNDSASLPANPVSQLMIDKNKNLWLIISGLNVGIFDKKNFTYHEVPLRPGNEASIYAEKKLVQDDDGNIFVILWDAELLTYNEQKNEFAPAYNFIHLPPGWKITGLTHLPGTKKYVIGTGKGIAVYNRATDQLSYTGHNEANDPLVDKIGTTTSASDLLVDSRDRLWFDSWETGGSLVYCFDTKTNSNVLYRYDFQPLVNSYHELKGLLEQRNGDIWIKGLGVFGHYNEKEKKFELVYNGYESEQSIAYNKVNALFEDREENIWIATDLNGLYRFNPREQFFTSVRQVNRNSGKPGNGSAMSFVLTKKGDLLVGTWEDGMYRYDRNYNPLALNMPEIEKPNPSMWSMIKSGDSNTIWMGAQPGLWRVDQVKGTIVFYNPALIKNRTIRQVAEDRYGNLWLGTQSIGLFKWTASAAKKKFDDGISFIPGLPAGMITRIKTDQQGLVWVATPAFGLYVIDPTTDTVLMHFGAKEPEERRLTWDGVNDVLQYDDSTIIIASNSLAIFDTKRRRIIKTIQLSEAVAGSIAALVRDKQGYIWMSATSGIYRLNLHNRIFIQFDRTDGMANDRFIIAASYVLPDGKILFGADNGFVSFDPEQVRMNIASPDITITGFKLGNQSLHLDSLMRRKQIELSPKENSITVEFAGLSYNNAFIIRYKLEGLETEWKMADKNYQAIYSYLPPGTYTFLARSEDAEGDTSKNITRLTIVIHPPFWKTWWFFCLLALLVAGIFYWLDKQRVSRLLALQDVRTEIASNLHEEVNTTLNNINLLSEMARIKADKDIDRSKEFIDEISHKSHTMILAMDDILWSIDPRNDSMEKSLLRMMEFSDVLKNMFGASIEIALDKKVRSLNLDMKTRHDVFLIFKQALQMMVEQAGGKQTIVHIDLFKHKLSIKLQDATASVDRNTTAIDDYIKAMNAQAVMINADLDVQLDNKGMAIVLLVPVK